MQTLEVIPLDTEVMIHVPPALEVTQLYAVLELPTPWVEVLQVEL